jgi:hypothetical protein
MKIKYTIEKVNNGWTIESEDEYGNSDTLVGREDEFSEVDTFMQFLYDIKEQFGPHEDSFSDSVIRLVKLPGDEFDGQLSPEREHELRDSKEYIEQFLSNE